MCIFFPPFALLNATITSTNGTRLHGMPKTGQRVTGGQMGSG